MTDGTVRSIPSTLAAVVAWLELERPRLVTAQQVATVVGASGIKTSPGVVLHRLARHGWLLPTAAHGVWEFAPAERSGAFSDGDPWAPVRAVLAAAPATRVAVALGSALLLRGIADRGPDRLEVAIPEGVRPLRGLARACRVTHFTAHLPAENVGGVPVHRPASVLVHAAHRPADVRSWGSVQDVLGALAAEVSEHDLREELAARSRATHVRVAYLLSGVAPALAEAVMPSGRQRVWFGPRGHPRRYDAARGIADTILPMAPTEAA